MVHEKLFCTIIVPLKQRQFSFMLENKPLKDGIAIA